VLIDPVYLAIAGEAALYLAVMIRTSIREGRRYNEQRRRMESDRPVARVSRDRHRPRLKERV
jgi:hypothetical protein